MIEPEAYREKFHPEGQRRENAVRPPTAGLLLHVCRDPAIGAWLLRAMPGRRVFGSFSVSAEGSPPMIKLHP